MRLPALAVLMLVACEPVLEPGSTGNGTPVGFTVTPVGHRRAFELTGGTVVLAERGALAAIADADGNRVWLVNLSPVSIRGQVGLPVGSQPGRMAIDDAGDVYVALRALGQVAKISTSTKTVVLTRDVCPEPRGLTWDHRAGVM